MVLRGSIRKQKEDSEQNRRKNNLDSFNNDPYIGYETLELAEEDCKNSSQAEVIARLLNRENVFISGPAGSGKSTVIKKFVEIIDAEFQGIFNVSVTASTGLAASILGGSTIHSWSGLGIYDKKFDPKNLDKEVKLFLVWDKIKYTDVLIIDEISMLHAYYLDNIDAVCKHIRRNNKPFGGIQVVFLGDFQQLPPVNPKTKDPDLNYGYAINAESWINADITTCYLDKVHRASDKLLQYVLKSIETNKVNESQKVKAKTMSVINACKNNKKDPKKVYTTLYTTNANVDKYNIEELKKNPNELFTFDANRVEGDKKKIDQLIKNSNIPEKLSLKTGATVIITQNILEPISKGESTIVAANGSVGKIERIIKQRDYEAVYVKLNNGKTVLVEKKSYIKEKKVTLENTTTGKPYDINIPEAVVKQLPLKLGYAITVHKSQGQTLESVEVDLSKCFIPGLGYVALSRVKSSKNLIIKDFNEKALEISKDSIEIAKKVRQDSLKNREQFLKEIDYYNDVLVNVLTRMILWPEDDSGVFRKNAWEKKKKLSKK